MRTALRAASRLVTGGGLGLAALLIATTTAAAAAPAEKTLPSSTIGFIKVESVAKLRAAFEDSQIGRLLADPALKPLKQDVAAKLEGPSRKLKEAVGVTLRELVELPTGPAWLAAIGRDDAKAPVALLISADAGSNDKTMADVMARATKKAEEDGAKVSTEEFKGLTLTTIKSTKEDEQDNPPLVWTRSGPVFHVATDAAALKDLISHPDGREDSLDSSESFAAVRKKLGGEGQAFWYLDIAQAIKLAAQVAGDQVGNAEQITAQLQLLGLNSLKAAGGVVGFGVDQYDSVTKTFVYSPGPSQGLLKIFSLPAVALKPQPWVPASAASYQSISWDLDNAYNAINDLVDMFAPGMLGNFEKQLGGPNGQGLSFQKDIFGPVGDRITVVSDFKKPVTEKSQRMLVAVELEDAQAFQQTLNKVLDMAKASPAKREFQGTTIYDFSLGNVPNAEAMNLPDKVSLAIARDNLFLTSEPSLLEQVLRPGGPALADSPEFQAVARLQPEKASTLSFQKPEESARLVYDMIKSGQLGKALENAPGEGAEGAKKLGEAIDPDKIPDFEVFARYLTPSGGFSQQDEDGFTITQFTLKKPNP